MSEIAINVFGGPMKHLTAMFHAEMRCELAEYRRLAALAATGDAPLTGERLDKLRHIFETHRDIHPTNSTEQLVAVFALEVLTACTTLAVQLAAVRAERDALRERWERFGRHAMQWLWPGTGAEVTIGQLREELGDLMLVPARPTDTGRDG